MEVIHAHKPEEQCGSALAAEPQHFQDTKDPTRWSSLVAPLGLAQDQPIGVP